MTTDTPAPPVDDWRDGYACGVADRTAGKRLLTDQHPQDWINGHAAGWHTTRRNANNAND